MIKAVVRRFMAKGFPTDQALNDYLKDHPKADKSKHHVEDDDSTKELREYHKNFTKDREKKEKRNEKVKNKKHDEDFMKGLEEYNRKFMKDREKKEKRNAPKDEKKEASDLLWAFRVTADFNDNLVEVQEALKEKDRGALKKALDDIRGAGAAKVLLTALRRTGISTADALKLM